MQANQLWEGARFRRNGASTTFQVVRVKQRVGAPFAEGIWAVEIRRRKLFGLLPLGWKQMDQVDRIDPREEVEVV